MKTSRKTRFVGQWFVVSRRYGSCGHAGDEHRLLECDSFREWFVSIRRETVHIVMHQKLTNSQLSLTHAASIRGWVMAISKVPISAPFAILVLIASGFQSFRGLWGPAMHLHRVSKKTSTHIIGYKLRYSCPILIIFDIKIPHIIWHRTTA